MSPVDALLVLQRSDVAVLAQQQPAWADTLMLSWDPGILDELIKAGFSRYELRRLEVPASLQAEATARAHVLAASMDGELTEHRQALFGGDAPLQGWDLTLLFMPLVRAHIQRKLGALAEQAFPETRLGLLRPCNPAFFNWDARLYTDLVAADAGRWQVLHNYASGRFWNPAMLGMVLDGEAVVQALRHAVAAAGGHSEVAYTHLPTCFYDAQVFASAVQQRFKAIVDLPSVLWDIPVLRPQHPQGLPPLRPLRQSDLTLPVLRYQERAQHVLREALRPLIPQRQTLDHQVQAWAQRCLLQAVSYEGLRRALNELPTELRSSERGHWVLSDHDAGFHGPLFSLAAGLGQAITVLPHSAYPTAMLPHAQRVTAVSRAGLGAPAASVWNEPVASRAVRFGAETARAQPRAEPAEASPLSVCLLLNTMCAEGLSYVEIFELIQFHQRLRALCDAAGATLQVRAKPGMPALHVLAAALRLPVPELQAPLTRPLQVAAEEADLCIAFGEPTSAISSFLDAGCLVLHASNLRWPLDYRMTMPQVSRRAGALVNSLDCDAALRQAQQLLQSRDFFTLCLHQQAQVHAQACVAAHTDFFDPPAAAIHSATPATAVAASVRNVPVTAPTAPLVPEPAHAE